MFQHYAAFLRRLTAASRDLHQFTLVNAIISCDARSRVWTHTINRVLPLVAETPPAKKLRVHTARRRRGEKRSRDALRDSEELCVQRTRC